MYTTEQLGKMQHMGILGYPFEKVVNIMDIEDSQLEQFKKDWNNPESELMRKYQQGVDKAEYAIDIKLFELASKGDLKALQKYEERKAYSGRK